MNLRQTFLRWHLLGGVPHHLQSEKPGNIKTGELFRTDELLGLDFLINSVPDNSRENARKLLNPQTFFYGLPDQSANYSDTRLYLPVPLRNHSELSLRYKELSELLSDLDQQGISQGIILVGDSGGGKTTALLKAMNDCLFAREHEEVPLLNGFLPCRLQCDLEELQPDDVLEQLLLYSARLPYDNYDYIKRVKKYLERGPKLLLLCDLNAVPLKNRNQVVEALRNIQSRVSQKHADSFPHHRVVIAYRSTRLDDGLLIDLTEGNNPLFQTYELETLNARQACGYIENLRRVESIVYEHCSLAPPVRDVNSESQKLNDFTNRFTSNGETLVSLPLLMHFVSVLSGAELSKVQTIADLYDYVVNRMLDYNRHLYATKMPAILKGRSGNTIIRALMTRIALAILGQGENEVKINVQKCRRLLSRPEQYTTFEPLWPLSDSPYEDLWDVENCLYYRNVDPLPESRMTTQEQDGILEFTLLRCENMSIGFLHDSFIYFFAGYQALWDWGASEIESGPFYNKKWYEITAYRLSSYPKLWTQPVYFLAGKVSSDGFHTLLAFLIANNPSQGHANLILRYLSGRNPNVDSVISGIVQKAIIRRGTDCHKNPLAILSACYNDLGKQVHYSECIAYAEKLKKFALDAKVLLLSEYVNPTNNEVITVNFPLHRITAFIFQTKNHLLVGGSCGTLIQFNISNGQSRFIYKHPVGVTAIAIGIKDEIIIACRDCKIIKITEEKTFEQVVSINETLPVKTTVVTGGGTDLIVRHEKNSFNALAMVSNGDIYAGTGRAGCTVGSRLVCIPSDGNAPFGITEHRVPILSIDIDKNTSFIYLAGGEKFILGVKDSAYILRYDPFNNHMDVVQLPEKYDVINCIKVLPDGTVIATTDNGQVLRVDGLQATSFQFIDKTHNVSGLAHTGEGQIWVTSRSSSLKSHNSILLTLITDQPVHHKYDSKLIDGEPLLCTNHTDYLAIGIGRKVIFTALNGTPMEEPFSIRVNQIACSDEGMICWEESTNLSDDSLNFALTEKSRRLRYIDLDDGRIVSLDSISNNILAITADGYAAVADGFSISLSNIISASIPSLKVYLPGNPETCVFWGAKQAFLTLQNQIYYVDFHKNSCSHVATPELELEAIAVDKKSGSLVTLCNSQLYSSEHKRVFITDYLSNPKIKFKTDKNLTSANNSNSRKNLVKSGFDLIRWKKPDTEERESHFVLNTSDLLDAYSNPGDKENLTIGDHPLLHVAPDGALVVAGQQCIIYYLEETQLTRVQKYDSQITDINTLHGRYVIVSLDDGTIVYWDPKSELNFSYRFECKVIRVAASNNFIFIGSGAHGLCVAEIVDFSSAGKKRYPKLIKNKAFWSSLRIIDKMGIVSNQRDFQTLESSLFKEWETISESLRQGLFVEYIQVKAAFYTNSERTLSIHEVISKLNDETGVDLGVLDVEVHDNAITQIDNKLENLFQRHLTDSISTSEIYDLVAHRLLLLHSIRDEEIRVNQLRLRSDVMVKAIINWLLKKDVTLFDESITALEETDLSECNSLLQDFQFRMRLALLIEGLSDNSHLKLDVDNYYELLVQQAELENMITSHDKRLAKIGYDCAINGHPEYAIRLMNRISSGDELAFVRKAIVIATTRQADWEYVSNVFSEWLQSIESSACSEFSLKALIEAANEAVKNSDEQILQISLSIAKTAARANELLKSDQPIYSYLLLEARLHCIKLLRKAKKLDESKTELEVVENEIRNSKSYLTKSLSMEVEGIKAELAVSFVKTKGYTASVKMMLKSISFVEPKVWAINHFCKILIGKVDLPQVCELCELFKETLNEVNFTAIFSQWDHMDKDTYNEYSSCLCLYEARIASSYLNGFVKWRNASANTIEAFQCAESMRAYTDVWALGQEHYYFGRIERSFIISHALITAGHLEEAWRELSTIMEFVEQIREESQKSERALDRIGFSNADYVKTQNYLLRYIIEIIQETIENAKCQSLVEKVYAVLMQLVEEIEDKSRRSEFSFKCSRISLQLGKIRDVRSFIEMITEESTKILSKSTLISIAVSNGEMDNAEKYLKEMRSDYSKVSISDSKYIEQFHHYVSLAEYEILQRYAEVDLVPEIINRAQNLESTYWQVAALLMCASYAEKPEIVTDLCMNSIMVASSNEGLTQMVMKQIVGFCEECARKGNFGLAETLRELLTEEQYQDEVSYRVEAIIKNKSRE
ncbi:MAG: hypothetical protein RIC33_21615 [Gimesia maris]